MDRSKSAATLLDRCPTGGARLLPLLAAEAARRNLRLYLVGGAVRDLLLGRVPADLDLVVEGNAVELATLTARDNRLSARTHPRFGTVRLEDRHGSRLDLAMARTETYEASAGLPTVRPASLAEDLRRRDFTINALAMPLHDGEPGPLIDPMEGTADLERCFVRILHDRSFHDDPCRAFRAVRYAARLGFRLESKTAHLLTGTVQAGGVGLLSPFRLGRELMELAREHSFAPAFLLAQQLGLLAAVHPELTIPSRAWQALVRQSRPSGRRPSQEASAQVVGVLALLAAGASPAGRKEIFQRLQLPRHVGRPLQRLLVELDGQPGDLNLPPTVPAGS